MVSSVSFGMIEAATLTNVPGSSCATMESAACPCAFQASQKSTQNASFSLFLDPTGFPLGLPDCPFTNRICLFQHFCSEDPTTNAGVLPAAATGASYFRPPQHSGWSPCRKARHVCCGRRKASCRIGFFSAAECREIPTG